MTDNLDPTHADEEACGKLWEVYVQEAQRYDEGLVRSWKEDMDVTLVFSGLYSAVLTAFIIESYQNLQEDPADISLDVLKQISSQISALSGTGILAQEPPKIFVPTPSALACNILWFASLSLALLCAFLATFVQQWSRKFLHRTTMIRSPSAQAHLIQFLYFGLKNLGVHTVVDAIPSLLHLSIFLFFAGLLVFLVDVNHVLVYMIAVVLTIIILLYIFFTIAPIITLRSFYRTPLSPVIWGVWRSLSYRFTLKNILNTLSLKRKPVYDPEKPALNVTATPAQSTSSKLQVQLPSNLQNATLAACRVPNADHELHSIAWTMKSVYDDEELLPFVEALVDALWGPNGPHDGNHYLIRPLLETSNPHLNIIKRVFSLLKNAQNPWFNGMHQKRCAIVCPKFFWVVARILIQSPNMFTLPKLPGMDVRSIAWFPFDILEHFQQLGIAKSGSSNYSGSTSARSAAILCALSMRTTIRHALVEADMRGEPLYYVQLEPLVGWLSSDLLEEYTTTPMKRIDGSRGRQIYSELSALFALRVDEYLIGAASDIPSQFDQTIACFGQAGVELYPHDHAHYGRWACSWSFSPGEYEPSTIKDVLRRVCNGEWETRFHDLVDDTDPANWNQDYFIALTEAVKRNLVDIFENPHDAVQSPSAQPPHVHVELQFWDTYLEHYRNYFIANAVQVHPLATSLQFYILIFFFQSNDRTRLSSHLPSYLANDTQLHDFFKKYINGDLEQLYPLLLLLLLTDSSLKTSTDLLSEILDFYMQWDGSQALHSKSKLFVLSGVLKEFASCTQSLANDWVRGPSVQRLRMLRLVWNIWYVLKDSSEISSKPWSGFVTLFDAGELLLSAESREMITRVKEDAGPENWWEYRILWRNKRDVAWPDLEEVIDIKVVRRLYPISCRRLDTRAHGPVASSAPADLERLAGERLLSTESRTQIKACASDKKQMIMKRDWLEKPKRRSNTKGKVALPPPNDLEKLIEYVLVSRQMQ